MSSTSGPVALVTGVEGDLGLQVARQLARSGAVVLVGARTAGAAQELVAQDTALEALGVDLDPTDDHSLVAAVSAVEGTLGRLDVLVHVAGAATETPLPAASRRPDLEDSWLCHDAVVFGGLRLTRAFLPLLLRSGHPRVLLVGGGSGLSAGPRDRVGAGAADARAGLDALTCLLVAELGCGGIRVDAPAPLRAHPTGP